LTRPSWLAAADFNHDHDADLAVAVSSGRIVVLLGDGAGGFTDAPGSPITFGSPHNLRAVDFDRDGELDLGVDTLSNDSFNVLLGDGHGSFQPANTTPVGDGPLSMSVGDFDDDDKPDVAVGNHFDDSVTVLLNRTITPADAVAALQEDVLASSVTFRNGLAAKLDQAARTAGVANGKACAALDFFIAMVHDKTGSGGLTSTLADEWVAEADAVRADLGCAA
jgi:FG-GAP-like repeat